MTIGSFVLTHSTKVKLNVNNGGRGFGSFFKLVSSFSVLGCLRQICVLNNNSYFWQLRLWGKDILMYLSSSQYEAREVTIEARHVMRPSHQEDFHGDPVNRNQLCQWLPTSTITLEELLWKYLNLTHYCQDRWKGRAVNFEEKQSWKILLWLQSKLCRWWIKLIRKHMARQVPAASTQADRP